MHLINIHRIYFHVRYRGRIFNITEHINKFKFNKVLKSLLIKIPPFYMSIASINIWTLTSFYLNPCNSIIKLSFIFIHYKQVLSLLFFFFFQHFSSYSPPLKKWLDQGPMIIPFEFVWNYFILLKYSVYVVLSSHTSESSNKDIISSFIYL